MTSLQEVCQWIDGELGLVIDTPPERVAERNALLRHFFQINTTELLMRPQQPIMIPRELIAALEKRVVDRMPLQYVLGEAAFYGRMFVVTPDVLIPRPETELLVEAALTYTQTALCQSILELGTGSGCIAISLKLALPRIRMTASDISEKALVIAQGNADKHKADIQWAQGNWFMPFGGQTFDLIISNPPYIARDESENLSPEVLQEPDLALFSEGKPVNLYESLLKDAPQYLSPEQGAVMFEVGQGQAEAVKAFADNMGYTASVQKDYANTGRIVMARRGGESA